MPWNILRVTMNIQHAIEQHLENDLAASLLEWYGKHARDLPWRAKPGETPDPYRVWLSEIMLQQTTVAAVKDYFQKFVARWPTVHDLAAADRDDIMRAWAGLGYYARARNLHACAKTVSEKLNGVFPDSLEGLLQLPGVGPYTAGAIASIAFDRPVAAVDGNVERVISRLSAIETPLPDSKPEIKMRTQALVPSDHAGDFAQAMMDLGATVCTPKSPNCLICPWTEHCIARRRGIQATLPLKRPKSAVPTRFGHVFWLEDGNGKVLLRKRPDKGLLGGMLEVPTGPWLEAVSLEVDAPIQAEWIKLPGKVEHTFTHFHLELVVHRAAAMNVEVKPETGDCRWVSTNELQDEALPTVMQKVVRHVLQKTQKPQRRPPTSSR
jgi:A/G-specific adenine glycosylase